MSAISGNSPVNPYIPAYDPLASVAGGSDPQSTADTPDDIAKREKAESQKELQRKINDAIAGGNVNELKSLMSSGANIPGAGAMFGSASKLLTAADQNESEVERDAANAQNILRDNATAGPGHGLDAGRDIGGSLAQGTGVSGLNSTLGILAGASGGNLSTAPVISVMG